VARLARAYTSTGAHWRRLLTVLNAAFDGLWLGLMDRETLAGLDEQYYEDRRESFSGRSYAYVDDAYNLQGLQPWEAAAVDEHFTGGARVVVTGAGTGREVHALLERGFDAIGYEPHPMLLRAGADFLRRHGQPDRLRASERDTFPTDVDGCDAVVVGWGSYTAIPGSWRRIAFLRAARESLPEGAPVLVSFFVRRGPVRYFRLVAAVGSAVRRLRGRERVELGDGLNPHYGHYFTRQEIEAELSAAGFRLVSFSPEPYGHALARAA
jgi:hypothetical protein